MPASPSVLHSAFVVRKIRSPPASTTCPLPGTASPSVMRSVLALQELASPALEQPHLNCPRPRTRSPCGSGLFFQPFSPARSPDPPHLPSCVLPLCGRGLGTPVYRPYSSSSPIQARFAVSSPFRIHKYTH